MPDIDSLSIRIGASSNAAANSVDRLASTLGRLRGVTRTATNNTEALDAGMRSATERLESASRSASLASRSVKTFGRDVKDSGNAAKNAARGTNSFFDSLKRIAYYRFVRTVIKEITAAFKEGITNLYHYSDAINGHFASSLDRLATSTLYLKNSLGAMVSPLIETAVPIIDFFVDKTVIALNYVNQFFSALSGKSTYTAAKKIAAVWDDSTKNTAKSAKNVADEVKRTILGFDEINKLVKATSSGGGSGNTSGKKTPDYSSMFEERPIEGILGKLSNVTKDWPDWLKALLGIGTVVGGLALLKQIPKLLGKMKDALKSLVALNPPSWLKSLLAPSSSVNGENPLSKKIDLGLGEMAPELKDGLKLPVSLSKTPSQLWDGFKTGWQELGSPKVSIKPSFDTTPRKLWDLFKVGWLLLGTLSLSMTAKITTKPSDLWNDFKTRWGLVREKELDMQAVIETPPRELRDLFKAGWLLLGDVKLSMKAAITTTPKELWENLKVRWGLLRNTTLSLSAQLVTTPRELWDLFKVGWLLLGDRQLGMKARITNTPRELFDDFEARWNLLEDRFLDISLNLLPVSISSLERAVGDAVYVKVSLTREKWKTISKWVGDRVSVGIALVKSGWEELSKWIGNRVVVNVELNRLGWKSIESWIGDKLDVFVSLLRNNWRTLNEWAGDSIGVYVWLIRANFSDISSWVGNYVDVYIGLRPWGWTSLRDWLGGSVTIDVSLSNGGSTTRLSGNTGGFGGATGGGGSTLGGGAGNGRHAKGGILRDGWNAWRNIPTYAGGTYNAHGSLFLAGESGPEIVGHLGGRTEVLNKSQLAMTMFEAVHSAMTGISFDLNAGNDGGGDAPDALFDTIMMAVQTAIANNPIDRERNDILRRLEDKELTAEVTAADIARAQQRYNRRAGTTVSPVGT